jgi:hypothetical protein
VSEHLGLNEEFSESSISDVPNSSSSSDDSESSNDEVITKEVVVEKAD